MLSSRFAVASSPDEEQLAMSPAPTNTTPAGGVEVVTVIADAPLTLPDVARIVALPAATPVTRPDAETVATAALDDDQTMVAGALAGDGVAVSWADCPTITLAADGDTVIDLSFGPPRA